MSTIESIKYQVQREEGGFFYIFDDDPDNVFYGPFETEDAAHRAVRVVVEKGVVDALKTSLFGE